MSQSRRHHWWVPSPLGHGNKMCKWCRITDLEAVAIKQTWCEHAPSTTPIGDMFSRDVLGEPIDPDKMYFVKITPREDDRETLTDVVSGEDLLAAAAWYDEYVEKKKDDT